MSGASLRDGIGADGGAEARRGVARFSVAAQAEGMEMSRAKLPPLRAYRANELFEIIPAAKGKNERGMAQPNMRQKAFHDIRRFIKDNGAPISASVLASAWKFD
jgi:hypothetical protein